MISCGIQGKQLAEQIGMSPCLSHSRSPQNTSTSIGQSPGKFSPVNKGMCFGVGSGFKHSSSYWLCDLEQIDTLPYGREIDCSVVWCCWTYELHPSRLGPEPEPGPEQRLPAVNPLRDCLIDPVLLHAPWFLPAGSWNRLLPFPRQACEACTPSLGW